MESDYGKPVELKRQITLFQAVGICVGYMIGSGIFVSPYGVLKEVNSVGMSLVIWGSCGVFNMLGALCYAELGTTITRSGGEYTYIHKGFGRFPAFLALWITYVLILSVMTAACTLIFATYMLQPVFPTCDVPDSAVKLVAATTLCKYRSLWVVVRYELFWQHSRLSCLQDMISKLLPDLQAFTGLQVRRLQQCQQPELQSFVFVFLWCSCTIVCNQLNIKMLTISSELSITTIIETKSDVARAIVNLH